MVTPPTPADGTQQVNPLFDAIESMPKGELAPASRFLFENVDPLSQLPAHTFASERDLFGLPPESLRRRSETDETLKASQLGIQRSAQANQTSNQRRSLAAAKFFVLNLVIMALAFGGFATMLYSFYQQNLLPQISQAVRAATVRHELDDASPLDTTRAQLASTQAALTKANDSILRLQRQYDALALKQQSTEASFAKMVEQLKQALAAKDSDGKPADATGQLSAALQVASVVPLTSPVNQELWLLKERNRLTFYADEAIALGHSEAMDNLWRSLDDPELAKLHDGAKAEIIRVQNYYSQLSRLPPDYRLPVTELFNDPNLRNEADLQPAQVTKLLLDPKQPTEIRARAAYVLGGHPKDTAVARALVQCFTTDPSLDVMKEAQRTLSEDHGMTIPPLHARAATAWWKDKTGGK